MRARTTAFLGCSLSLRFAEIIAGTDAPFGGPARPGTGSISPQTEPRASREHAVFDRRGKEAGKARRWSGRCQRTPGGVIQAFHFCGTTSVSCCFYRVIGGEGGIRTLGTLLTYTHFPGVLLKPLGHLSGEPQRVREARRVRNRTMRAISGRHTCRRRDSTRVEITLPACACTHVATSAGAVSVAPRRAGNASAPGPGTPPGPVIFSPASAMKQAVDGGPHRSPRIARS